MIRTVYKCEACGKGAPCTLIAIGELYDLPDWNCPYCKDRKAGWVKKSDIEIPDLNFDEVKAETKKEVKE